MRVVTIPHYAPLENVALYFKESKKYYIKIPQGEWFDGDFTLEAWVKVPDRFSSWDSIIDFGNGPRNNNVVFSLFQGVPFLATFSGSYHIEFDTGRRIPLNTWTYLSCTLIGQKARLYQNGELLRACLNMPIPPKVMRTTNYIGKSNWNKPYPNAFYKDIRIWKGALSPEQIQENMNNNLMDDPVMEHLDQNSPTLIGDWKCDEGYGGTVFNSAPDAPDNSHGNLGGGDRKYAPKWMILSQYTPRMFVYGAQIVP